MADTMIRRHVTSAILLGASGIAALLLAIPFVGYLLGPLLRPSPQAWRDVGAASSFRTGETVGVTFSDPFTVAWSGNETKAKAWLRKVGDTEFVAFSVHCTHLGCPVTWKPEAGIFLCPCHGGVFDARGKVAGGPPPRPLWQHRTRIRKGRVEIATRRLPVVETAG